MHPRRTLLTLAPLLLAASLSPVACSGENHEGPPDHHDDGEEAVGSVSSPLVPSDPVSLAAATTCTTSSVKGLSTQLLEEIQCLRPGTFTKIDKTPGLTLGSSVFPYLQTSAVKSLIAAQKARGTTMSINSALRTLPQQYILYRWYQTGRCNISLAASPGTSNHEGGIAIDINDNAGWRTALQNNSFRWLGANDPVHYDFIGGGTVNLKGLSVLAFQRLWNRNNPNDKIAEDSSYGPATAARIAKSPVGGFAQGADCTKPMPKPVEAGAEGGADAGEEEVPMIPDGPEPESDGGPEEPSINPLPEPDADAESGCAVIRRGPPEGGAGALALGVATALVVGARRRRRRR